MDPTLIGDHMSGLLTEETLLLARLERLLEKEAEVLQGDDLDAVESVGHERQRCTSSLLKIDQERRETCHMLGFDTTRAGFEALLAFCDPTGELNRRWQAELALLSRCQAANDRNGAVVTAKLRRVESVLAAVRGNEPAAQAYGSSGIRRTPARSLSLARA